MLNFTFDWIFFKLAGIRDTYKIWDEVAFRPDPINFYLILSTRKKCFGHDCPDPIFILLAVAGYNAG